MWAMGRGVMGNPTGACHRMRDIIQSSRMRWMTSPVNLYGDGIGSSLSKTELAGRPLLIMGVFGTLVLRSSEISSQILELPSSKST